MLGENNGGRWMRHFVKSTDGVANTIDIVGEMIQMEMGKGNWVGVTVESINEQEYNEGVDELRKRGVENAEGAV